MPESTVLPKSTEQVGATACPLKNPIQKVLLVLAVLRATSSVVNLVSRHLEFGLSPIFGDSLRYYRSIALSIAAPILALFHRSVPPAYCFDLWPLSCLAATAHAWALSETP